MLLNILIIEDDILLGSKLKKVFEKNILSNRVKTITSYNEFLLELGIINSYDIIIVDIILGEGLKKTGIDIIDIIRKKKLNIPIVVISGFGELNWIKKAFDSGANDYIIKPFRLQELEIRILKWFKTYFCSLPHSYSNIISYKGLSYSLEQNEFFFENKKLDLTKKNKYILSIFLCKQEKLIKNETLIEKIWGDVYDIVERNPRVSIHRLKDSLRPFGLDSWICNIRGEGYMLKESCVK